MSHFNLNYEFKIKGICGYMPQPLEITILKSLSPKLGKIGHHFLLFSTGRVRCCPGDLSHFLFLFCKNREQLRKSFWLGHDKGMKSPLEDNQLAVAID